MSVFTVRLSVAALAMIFCSGAWAANGLPEREIAVGINDVFVPGGMNSSSDVYAIASGIFPNGCYKWKRAEVTHPTAYVHEVKTIASVTQGMCIMVLIPFSRDIQFGKFAPGRHTLRFLSGDGTRVERIVNIDN